MSDVDGVDYSPEGIQGIRDDLVYHRNHALGLGEMRYAVLMSHVIALLAKLQEYEEGKIPKPTPEPVRKATPPGAQPSAPRKLPPLPPMG